MKLFKNWITLDWVKLVVALTLFFLMILFWQEKEEIQRISVSALPPYPESSFNWHFDFENTTLINPDGNKVYMLSEDGKRWQPIIPAEVLGQLPAKYEVLQAIDGEWMILDQAGAKLAGLDPVEHKWKAVLRVPTKTLTFTRTPIPSETNTLEPSLTPTITETFTETATRTETPTITQTFTHTVTNTFTATFTVTNTKTPVPSKTAAPTKTAVPTKMAVPTKTFTLVPSWTPWPTSTSWPTNKPWPTSTTIPPTKTIPPTSALSGEIDIADCPASAPSQLQVGDTAVAMSNLYLRTVPYVGDNVLTYNVVGAELQVIDGPLCKPHADGYYIWWLVESPYGLVGWTAETTLHTGEYLMIPAE
jgi:hypothetical protein